MAEERVALCPVTEELVSHLLALAELDLTDADAVGARTRQLGWPDWSRAVRGPAYENTSDVPEATHVTPYGHFVTCDGDGSLYLPFAYLYTVDGGLLDEDCWGTLPGWRSEEGAWRPEFDAHVGTVVQRFTDRLGLPDHDIRQPKYDTRYVSWRLDHTVLLVGQGPEPLSYHQFEDAHVHLLSRTATDAPYPEGQAMRALLAT
ncbi:hypothetical protein [Streptomyces sp. A012304]|uniref:hypothetical protein n=1 Tax=Streptomyces sp. A012304 TaxID=375446 RepID=UPI00222F7578|nr:hypothetical protein [Streptomyces sp. A012304]GKQ33965.1 hypothetical protein ALMP_05160 [Streptomyces sp. A012304]